MAHVPSDPIVRRLLKAEGFLELGLPARALEILQERDHWETMAFEANALMGEALRGLKRHRDAIKPLERAAALRPGHVGVALALGWCYKRTHKLAQAIDALERSCREHPEQSILHYNLACYWSLAGNVRKASGELGLALILDPSLRARVDFESDFDPIRCSPEFLQVTRDCVAQPQSS